jgi:hypothetical protein
MKRNIVREADFPRPVVARGLWDSLFAGNAGIPSPKVLEFYRSIRGLPAVYPAIPATAIPRGRARRRRLRSGWLRDLPALVKALFKSERIATQPPEFCRCEKGRLALAHQTNSFLFADHLEIGQTSQYKGVSRYQSDGRIDNFQLARHPPGIVVLAEESSNLCSRFHILPFVGRAEYASLSG